jgi:predicted GNAT family acetyltransferase
MADVTVTRDDGRRRYEATVAGERVGFASFRSGPGLVTFTHTEVEPAFEGKGIASALARQALDDVRARGERVVAECPFIAGWIARHDEYRDLVAG